MKRTIEKDYGVSFINPMLNAINEVKNLLAEYPNEGSVGITKNYVLKTMLKAFTKATNANNVPPIFLRDYDRQIRLLNNAYGDWKVAADVLTTLTADKFNQKVINDFNPILENITIAINEINDRVSNMTRWK